MKLKNLLLPVAVMVVMGTLTACGQGGSQSNHKDGKTVVSGGAKPLGSFTNDCTIPEGSREGVCKASEDLPESFTCILGGEYGIPVDCYVNDEGELVFLIPDDVLPNRDMDVCVKAGAEDCLILGRVRVEREMDATPPPPPPSDDPQPALCQQTGCPEGFLCGADGVCVVDPNVPPPPPPPPAPETCRELGCPEGQVCGDDGTCLVVAPPPPAEPPSLPPDLGAMIARTRGQVGDARQLGGQRLSQSPVLLPGSERGLGGGGNDGENAAPAPFKVSFVRDGENRSGLIGDGREGVVLGTTRLNWRVEGTRGENPRKLDAWGVFNRHGVSGCGAQRHEGEWKSLGVREDGMPIEPRAAEGSILQYYVGGRECTNETCPGYEIFGRWMSRQGTVCRIDLMPVIREGGSLEDAFYTINHGQPGFYFLAGESADGRKSLDILRVDSPEPETTPTLRFARLNGMGVVHVVIEYNRTIEKPSIWNSKSRIGDLVGYGVDGSCKPDPNNDNQERSSGRVAFDCDLKSSGSYYIQVRGLADVVEKHYRLQCADPVVDMGIGRYYLNSSDDVTLRGSVSRQCQLFQVREGRDDRKLAEEKLPGGVSALRIAAYNVQGGDCGTSETIHLPQGVEGLNIVNDALRFEAHLPRNHTCYRYEFRVRDERDRLYAVQKKYGYTPVFKLVGNQGQFLNQQEQINLVINYGDCVRAPDDFLGMDVAGCARYRHDYSWSFIQHANFEVRHVRSISTRCRYTGQDDGSVIGGAFLSSREYQQCSNAAYDCNFSLRSEDIGDDTQFSTLPDGYGATQPIFAAWAGTASSDPGHVWTSTCSFIALDYEGNSVPLTDANGNELQVRDDYGLTYADTSLPYRYVFTWLNNQL